MSLHRQTRGLPSEFSKVKCVPVTNLKGLVTRSSSDMLAVVNWLDGKKKSRSRAEWIPRAYACGQGAYLLGGSGERWEHLRLPLLEWIIDHSILVCCLRQPLVRAELEPFPQAESSNDDELAIELN